MFGHAVTTILTALVFFVASAVNGIAGFGQAQLALGLMPLFRTPSSATTLYTMVGAVSHVRVWWSVRDRFDWRSWLLPVSGLAAGMPVGIYVFENLNERELRLAIGITILIAVLFLAVGRRSSTVKAWIKNSHARPGWKSAVVAGFAAGVLGGAVAIPGPPMILYATFMLAADFWDGERMKATLTSFFATLIIYRLFSITLTGAVNLSLVREALWMVPTELLGAVVGVAVFNRIPRRMFDAVVLVLLTVNAVVLVATA